MTNMGMMAASLIIASSIIGSVLWVYRYQYVPIGGQVVMKVNRLSGETRMLYPIDEEWRVKHFQTNWADIEIRPTAVDW